MFTVNNATSACDSQCKKKEGVSVGIQVNLVYEISSEIVSKSDFIGDLNFQMK